MATYLDFLAEVEANFESKAKFQRYYLTSLVKNLDKAFVVDLSRVEPELLSPQVVIRETIEFIEFAVKSSEILEIDQCFQSFLVS